MITLATGVWLMAAPHFLGLGQFCSDHDRIVGPLVVAFSTIALSEVMRPIRFVVLVLGLWLVAAPLVLGYWSSESAATWSDIISGCVCVVASCFQGKVSGSYGGGWPVLWRRNAGSPG